MPHKKTERTCKCGEKFLGSTTAKYCYECKVKARNNRKKK